MATPIISRPSEKAIFLTASFGVVLAILALLFVPTPKPEGEDGIVGASETNRPTSGPARRVAGSQPVRPVSPPVEVKASANNAPVSGEAVRPEDFPTEIYAGLLDRFLKNGLVDYKGLAGEGRDDLARLVDIIANTDARALERLRDKAYSAWYVNAYNILTLELIVRNYPIGSIMDIDQPWDTPWPVAQRQLTLNEIEHDVLRLQNAPEADRVAFVDPRIHFAVNCASIGCPVLQPEPFTETNLERLYEAGVRDFMSADRNYRIDGKTWSVSQLMDWYGSDFLLHHAKGGNSVSDSLGHFFAAYETDETDASLLRSGGFEIEWLEYDWSLNKQ